MFNTQFDNSQPIYLQVINEIKKALVRGDLSPGDKLPSQRDLATLLKINPNTIQRAYRDMELIGIVETLRGQGTFLKQGDNVVETMRNEMVSCLVEEFILQMKSLGCDDEGIVSVVSTKVTEVHAPKQSSKLK